MVGVGEGRLGFGRMLSNEHDVQRLWLFDRQGYKWWPLVEPNIDSLGPPNNDSDGKHNGGNLGLDNPNDSFAFDGDDAMEDNELHMWFNITSRVFLSNLNVHLTTPT